MLVPLLVLYLRDAFAHHRALCSVSPCHSVYIFSVYNFVLIIYSVANLSATNSNVLLTSVFYVKHLLVNCELFSVNYFTDRVVTSLTFLEIQFEFVVDFYR